MRFIGRERELAELRKELNRKGKGAILIYGKRRIGKSTLISEALKDFEGIVIDHLCIKSTFEGNLDMLYRSVARTLGMPMLAFEQFFDLFTFLGEQKKEIVLVMDEYPYLKESRKKNEVDSYMQSIIDRLPENVKLILCGSYISIMKELLEEGNPLFGRFSLVMDIKEFDYYDASRFYSRADVRTKIERYAVFGGSPYVLSNLDGDAAIEDIIIEKLIPETSILRTYIESVALQEIRKSYDVRILERIGNGRKKYSEIASSLNSIENGYLDKQLKELLSMDTIQKEFPINKPGDKKKQFYSIRDNLMRFYFSFIFGNQAAINNIGERSFYRNYVMPAQTSFISLRFEEIVRQYFMRLARDGKDNSIIDIGTYWYDDPTTKTNGQFDCVLKTKSGYDFYECKFYEKAMSRKECDDEAEQLQKIPDIKPERIGFVSSSGFSFKGGPYKLIRGKDLFET